jgi:DNA-binding transcriptional regulator LsrR (DeoR family)
MKRDSAVWPSSGLGRSMFAHGHITTEERHRLVENGAVGEVLSQFFDSQGRRVPDELEARTIALSLDDLAAVPIVVAVACGVKKGAAIEGACRTGVVKLLVTDRVTAREVLRSGGTVFEGPGGCAVAGAGTRPGGDTM